MTFTDLKLTRQFLNAVEDAGYDKPSPIQIKAIPALRSGQDVIGIAQTGTGKTAAFLLPLLQHLKYAQHTEPRALVVAPTKELALQIHAEALKFASYTDLRIQAIYGGIGPKVQIERLQAGCDLIICTPGRFIELYSHGHLATKRIKHLVLDEADRMMDMGFMPQLRQIQEIIPNKRQNMLFSATFPNRVERLADEFLLWPTRIEVTPESTPVATVRQLKLELPNQRTKIAFIEWWITHHLGEKRMLIFARKKEEAESLAKYLQRSFDFEIRTIHSNKGQNSRINAMEDFRSGAVRVLVSTDVASRGIDVPETEMVINASVPRDPHEYVHRIGRTGRAFRNGTALTLNDPAERYALERIEELVGEPLELIEAPESLETFDTPKFERQLQAREIDSELRKRDPNYQGAFHEKKKKGSKGKSTKSGRKSRN
jgi:ATP-dependent RNA helicase RhlE|tara:strand:- start:1651 stop:2937 length:1287 start_codon:yes stop_codon:yes gene_type:complete